MSEPRRTLFGIEQPRQVELSGHTIRVAIDAGVDQCFDYAVPLEMYPVGLGQRVLVPFGRGDKLVKGFCVGIDLHSADKNSHKIKCIKEVVDSKPLLTERCLELANWISEYYASPLGQTISAMIPAAVKKGTGIVKKRFLYLNCSDQSSEEDESLDELKSKLKRAKKQLEVVLLLEKTKAFTPDDAIESSLISQTTGVSSAVVRKLIETGLVKTVKRSSINSLPAIPDDFVNSSAKDIVLNDEQIQALDHICHKLDTRSFEVSLLHGITDSGKTEIYIRAIDFALSQGRKAIVLLPEIALTTQTVRRFSSRFKRLAVLHSSLTDAQRNDQWQRIAAGKADVVIGARSAVFAPVENVGIIVVDEEHEGSYKQDVVPRYNGRDVAIKRAQIENAHCLLGSATPSLETLYNCQSKKHFKLLRLTKRVMDLPLPQMSCVDLSKIAFDPLKRILSEPLEENIKEVLERKEQAILLLNRRGYSNVVYCPSCKYILHCRNCDVSLTFHRNSKEDINQDSPALSRYIASGYTTCHYCGSRSLVPRQCPVCNHGLAMLGAGVQRLELELEQKFPQAKTRRIDSDSMRSADYYELLKDFAEGKIDILAGTQILAKGLHFPNVTLVGVVNADAVINSSDFRANEKTFQMISQVAGRTGRGNKPGKVIIQTMNPKQPAIRFAANYDFESFVDYELSLRQRCKLPPFSRMALILMRDASHERLEDASKFVTKAVQNIINAGSLDITVRGPMPCPIPRVSRMHRLQLVLIAPNPAILTKFFKIYRSQPPLKTSIKIAFDIDPIF